MKFKTTNKDIKNYYSKVFRIGYCSAVQLLRYEDPRAYTAGIYGWNADLYVVEGVALVTGYRPGVGEQINYDLLDKYEKKARKINDDYSRSYDSRKKAVTRLLHKFIAEITKEDGEQ